MATIWELEQGLLKSFPKEDAASWDRTGLQVGDPDNEISRIAVCLDPTVENIISAQAKGCNVLVSHHPPYLDAPDLFMPGYSSFDCTGAVVYEAARRDVALMCFHTALDFNPEGYKELPRLLGYDVIGVLDNLDNPCSPNGYGAICIPEEQMTVSELAQRCHERFGSPVQVWGDTNKLVEKFVTGQGSASSFVHGCIVKGIDCLVCGEMKYHAALDLSKSGVSIICLGHDISENPFINVLSNKIINLGISKDDIECLYRLNWSVL